MIDRYLLRYFLAVMDHGNFSRAADACNVTQPTLSVGIAKLEALLGKPVFNRSNRRVELTPAGARFADHARRIEAEFNLAERVVTESPAQGLVRIGVLNTLPSAIVADLARAWAKQDADRVEIIEGRERELLDRLASGRIDLALSIIRPEADRFASEALAREGYALAMADSHPLAHEPVIAAEALADNVMIVRRQCEVLPETSQHFTKRGVRPFFAARTIHDDRALAYVAAGLGITVMPDCYRASGVVRPRLLGFSNTRTIGILYGAQSDMPVMQNRPAVTGLRDLVPWLIGGNV